MATVSDSSPLIGLEQIAQLDLLRQLFQEILIPDAVAAETTGTLGFRSRIHRRSLSCPLLPETLRPALGPGEREAINLAVEVRAKTIIVDDEPARHLATRLGLSVIGTAGVLLADKERKFISAVKPHLDALRAKRFFLAPQVYDLILRKAGEL